MFPLAKQHFKRLIGIADWWDLTILKWHRKKVERKEKYDAILAVQGKKIQDVLIQKWGNNSVTLIFEDGSKLEVMYKSRVWTHNDKPHISTDIDWRLIE